MSRFRHEFPAEGTDGSASTVEVRADGDGSDLVHLGVTTDGVYVGVGVPAVVASQLARIVDEVVAGDMGTVVEGVDDYDQSPARLHVSSDETGVDFLFAGGGSSVRAAVDLDQVAGIAVALRGAADLLLFV